MGLDFNVMIFDDVAVWTDLLKIPVGRNLTPLAHQSKHTVNPSPNCQSHPCPNNSFLDRSRTPDSKAWEEIHQLEEVANLWNRRSQHPQALLGRPAAHSTPQFSPIPGRP